MEHRWGSRISVDITAPLRRASGCRSLARIVNISRSGALIRTDAVLPLFARVDIYLAGRGVPSFVARVDGDDIGVEWCEPAHEVLTALLRPAHAAADPPRTLDVDRAA